MIKKSKKIFELLIKEESNRRIGEISSKTGRDYEDKASFFILTRFNKLINVKSKINTVSFNGLEDLDVFDNNERIFCFQIKTRKHTWTKRDPELLGFLENCINRFNMIKNSSEQIEIQFYFFSDTTGNFLEDWNALHKENPDKLNDEVPVGIKKLLNKSNFSYEERNKIFSKIQFITSRKSTFLDPFIDNTLLTKFKEVKNRYEPGELIEFNLIDGEIFHEKRLSKSRVYAPEYQKDMLISNILEVEIPEKTIFCAEKKDKLVNKEIQDFLKPKKIRISYLLKYGKIYSFQNFDNVNPLTQFLKKGAKIQKINIDELDDSDKVQLLNFWLFHYLNYIRLKPYRKYFYFFSHGKDKYIDWYDSNARKIKNWKVVKKTENFFENLGGEIKFQTFENKFFLIIIPRLFFSINGELLLDPQTIRNIEKTYRKSFMKNDFLRRRLYVLISYIRGDVIQKKQQPILNFKDKPIKKTRVRKEWKFLDKAKVKFKGLIKLEASFKPNIESTVLPEDQKIF
jgi:hypothetical protein